MLQEPYEEPINTYEAYRNIADNRGQAIKLEFRFKDSHAELFEYSYLTRTTVSISASKLTMKFMDALVTIEGHNLTRLKDDLRHNKIDWIQETDSDFENTDSESVVVKKITIEEIEA